MACAEQIYHDFNRETGSLTRNRQRVNGFG
jgi:hypothetical protein